MKKVTFAIIGAILGIPLSYYFQSEMVRSKVGGIGGYFKHFGDIVKDGNLLGNVILSVLIFAIIGGLIGYFIDKNEVKNQSDSSHQQTPPKSEHEAANVKISAQQVSETSKDAIEVSKSFMSDPVGGLASVYLKLGEAKSLSVGILFMVITIILFVIGFILANSTFLGGILSILFMLAIVFVSLSVSRGMFNGKGTINSDILITGLSLLPFSVLIFVSSLVGVSYGWGFFAYLSFGLTYTILILFSGFTKIYQFSESKSSIFIAIILFLVLNAVNIVFKIIFS
ncbi:MAG: hypothetical protein FD143_2973 [Ignavibacteria bacterium]|nr:MAG: hypothetical protein FD143_2973 [Ignavibacteria bacterium]KAF0155232.1 MAG: hypothetical protein FD188_3179 [Ignavibacteria bacterium]